MSRDRLGGMNPYVVRIAGAPWGAYASETYAGGEWSWHVPVGTATELGVLLGGALIDDVRRVGGDSATAMVFGAGALADVRLGDWQLDLRAGWSPAVHANRDGPGTEGDRQGVSVMFGVGWGDS